MIDENRITNAMEKLNNLRKITRAQMKLYDKMYQSLIDITLERKVDFDNVTGEEIPNTERFEKRIDSKTFKEISDARREEIFVGVVPEVEKI